MTTSPLDKIRALVTRAAHPETPVEEARTSAVIACKLIVQEKVELVVKNGRAPPPPSGRVWAPGTGDVDWFSIFDEILRHAGPFDWRPPRPRPGPRPRRRDTFYAACPASLKLKCVCCKSPIAPGATVTWVGDRELIGAKSLAEVTHERCGDVHWAAKWCPACGKETNRTRRPKPKEKPGDVRAEVAHSSGYCACCGDVYRPGETIALRGFVVVHERCKEHLSGPCEECGGGGAF